MIWRYVKIIEDEEVYRYSYSNADEGYKNGEIMYDKKTRKATIVKVAESEIVAEWAIDQFEKVIGDNFPDERTVRTG